MKAKTGFYYGFWIVLVGFVINALSGGMGYYGFSVFNKPIGDEFHWSRSAVTAGYLVYSVSVAAFSPVVGRLTDRHGPRRVLLLGTVTLSVSLLLLSRISDLWNFYLLYLLLGIAIALVGAIPVNVSISHWFHRRVGTVQGLSLTGRGLGGLIMAPLLGSILIPDFGWRGAFLLAAPLMIVIMLPLLLLVLKDRPEQKGLLPYGQSADPSRPEGSSGTPVTGLSLREATRLPVFWIITLTMFAYGMCQTGALQNQVSILSTQGIALSEAVAAIGLVGLFSGVGKFTFGWLCDRTDPKYAAAISYLLIASALVSLALGSSMTSVWIYAILLGLGQGGWAPNLAMLSAKYFGLKHYGAVLGAMHFIFLSGEAVGPLLAGFSYDLTGSYQTILLVFIGVCLAAAPIMVTSRKPHLPT
ncbi:MFS transporter [Chloroflexota bacterium]